MEERTIEERVVIVTGASSGIGRAVAWQAARKGFRVVLVARREDRLRALAGQIAAAGGEARVVAADLSDLAAQERVIAETLQAFGRIDVLVNNAGLPLPVPFREATPEALRRQWDVNVTAVATLTRLALPHLERQGGSVINIGSSISRFPIPGMGNYSPTKIAVAGLSDALRRELAPRGVQVSLVEPGPIATEFSERAGGRSASPRNWVISAGATAVPIVRLFDHPRRRIVVPGWLSPGLLAGGALVRWFPALVDAMFARAARATRP